MPDPIYAALAPMLDGAHDVETIFKALSKTYAVAQVFEALDRLRISGYLADDTAVEARPTMSFWEQIGVAPSLARSRLERTLVSTVALGEVDIAPFADLLAREAIRVSQEGDVTVIITDDYLRPELAAWNAQSLISGRPWFLVKPVGMETWIGPMFVPGKTACWECLAQRLRGHRRIEEYLAQRTGNPVRPILAHIVSTRHAAFAEAATEIIRWIGHGGQSRLLNRVMSTNILTLERTHHQLVRRPQCQSCGSAEPTNGALFRPVRLRRRRKVHTSEGGHHALDHGEVLEQLERHLSPITGIVSTLVPGERVIASYAGVRCITPTFEADHNFSDIYDDRFFLHEGLRRRSGGKGMTVEQARTSALAESLERYCGVFDGTEPRIRASFDDLGKAAIHPNVCMGYSKRQYADREAHNRKGHKAHWVPEPFDESVEIEWTPLWSLSAKQIRYLPTSFCYFAYQSADPLFARANSNGCAAGAVIEEAILQGILELIERDAVALWWYNRLRRKAVDLDSVDDPFVIDSFSTTAACGATFGCSMSRATSGYRHLPRCRGGSTKPKRTSFTASARISIPGSHSEGRSAS